MAGLSPDFNGADFRDQMRNVFEIFSPPEVEERATFYFPNQLVYTVETDDDGVPFDRNAMPVTTVVPPLQLPCAVEYFDAAGAVTVFGVMVPSRAAITLLDEDFHLIDGSAPGSAHFSHVMLRGEKFVYRSTEYPTGLFDVGIYTIHVFAEEQR